MKIFIIDDDPLSIFVTKTMLSLKDATHEIVTFPSAEDALAAFQENQEAFTPDLVFLDLNMPEIDGWGFLEALNRLGLPLQQHCRLYILTSSVDSMDIAKGKDYPVVTGVMQKPLRSEEVDTIFAQCALQA